MDTKSLLDQILQSGKEMAQKGQAAVQNQVGNVSSQGVSSDTLKKGAMAAGVLALLLGTKTGRGATSTALKVGSLTALAGMAYQAYQKWQAGSGDATGMASASAATPAALEGHAPATTTHLDATTLLKVMIAAAKADGHVDTEELKTIRQQLAGYNLDAQLNDLILTEMTKPLTISDVAALANNDKAAAVEVYLVSKVVIADTNDAEKRYLDQLQQALGLPDDVVRTL